MSDVFNMKISADWIVTVCRSRSSCQSTTGRGNRPPICEDHPHPSPDSQQLQPSHSKQHRKGNKSVMSSFILLYFKFSSEDARHGFNEHTCVFPPVSSCSSGLHGERSAGPSAAWRSVRFILGLGLGQTASPQKPLPKLMYQCNTITCKSLSFRIMLKYRSITLKKYFSIYYSVWHVQVNHI